MDNCGVCKKELKQDAPLFVTSGAEFACLRGLPGVDTIELDKSPYGVIACQNCGDIISALGDTIESHAKESAALTTRYYVGVLREYQVRAALSLTEAQKKPELSAIGTPTDLKKYDAFEVRRCQEIAPKVIEAVDDNPLPDIPIFWTVYGHLPEGGVQALVDVTDEASANGVYDMLKMLRRGTAASADYCGYCELRVINCKCE